MIFWVDTPTGLHGSTTQKTTTDNLKLGCAKYSTLITLPICNFIFLYILGNGKTMYSLPMYY
jgi:hypothetical protein